MTERVLLKRYNYIKILGGFEKNNLSRVKTHLSLTKKSEIKISRVKYSKTNIFYLKKIINLLKLKRINYFLIRTPTHPMSLFRRNEKLYKKLLNNCLKCKGRFIDFADYRLADHNYYDLDHLNSKGAALFSKMFFKFSSRIK